MIVVPLQLHLVIIPWKSNPCTRVELDSTYPQKLNGIVNEQEFRESIDRINEAISPNSCYNILRFISLILSIITISFAITVVVYIAKGFYPVSSLAVSLSVSCTASATWGLLTELWIASRVASKLREAINSESEKYSSRTTNPSTWRSGTQDYVSTLHECCCCSVADSPPGLVIELRTLVSVASTSNN